MNVQCKCLELVLLRTSFVSAEFEQSWIVPFVRGAREHPMFFDGNSKKNGVCQESKSLGTSQYSIPLAHYPSFLQCLLSHRWWIRIRHLYNYHTQDRQKKSRGELGSCTKQNIRVEDSYSQGSDVAGNNSFFDRPFGNWTEQIDLTLKIGIGRRKRKLFLKSAIDVRYQLMDVFLPRFVRVWLSSMRYSR